MSADRGATEERAMPAVTKPAHEKGDFLVDYEDKKFEDVKAKPGEKALVTFHTVAFEGSIGLVNLLQATRLKRKGFETSILPRRTVADRGHHPDQPARRARSDPAASPRRRFHPRHLDAVRSGPSPSSRGEWGARIRFRGA
jgi:hypothetical protein